MQDNSSTIERPIDINRDHQLVTASDAASLNVSGTDTQLITDVSAAEAQPGGTNAVERKENTPPQTDKVKPSKQDESLAVLQAGKQVVKLYEGLIGFDANAEAQRATIRDLLAKQAKAMERKLHGSKPEEGEDFDGISKLLRRENNRLDSMLDGKETLVVEAGKAIDMAINALSQMKTRIIQMEEEG